MCVCVCKSVVYLYLCERKETQRIREIYRAMKRHRKTEKEREKEKEREREREREREIEREGGGKGWQIIYYL